MRITFWGAAETVTGSRFLVETRGKRVLVDCGLFQGIKRLRSLNWDPFPVAPASIDAVVLTHAHIDHTGYLPALVRDGFQGSVWCTDGTEALARILLLDSAHLHEEDARYANRHHSSRHHPALPLFTTEDAERALTHLRVAPFAKAFNPVPELTASFSPVGHILGAASVRVDDGTTAVAFTGDVGRPEDPLMLAPEPLPAADFVVTESTYGNRFHPRVDAAEELTSVITRTVGRGGSVLIPVFAVGRAQMMLHLLAQLRAAGRIPSVPTFLNSPMAINATELFTRFSGEHKLSDAECAAMFDAVEFVRTAEESKALTARRGPTIVLAASGMLTGGRVLHHLMALAPDPRNTILITGFQAAGTRGESLLMGARSVKVFGTYVPIRAEVARMESLSAHADADELVEWLGRTAVPSQGAAVVHGEASAADALRRRLHDELGWSARVPVLGDAIDLS
ncbi:MAG TPA: MBL fold metallo-hydrolase [Acidimicrobiales bacterium]|nr:MBL fold metallo-hydrolase [Acidimicrobiales bacterium]